MDPDAIIRYVTATFDSVDVVVASQAAGSPEVAWGDTFFIYDPHRDLEARHRFPFATIVTKDYGDFDRRSNLNRPGVFRLNIGVSQDTYRALFGPPPAPDAGDAVGTVRDFTALDQLLPHPVYAAQSWVCVLNPSDATFQAHVRPLLAAAYDLAVRRQARRQARD